MFNYRWSRENPAAKRLPAPEEGKMQRYRKEKINFWGTDFQWHCSKHGTLLPLATDSRTWGVKYPPCTGHHPAGTQPPPAAYGFFTHTATLLPFVPSKEERVGNQGTSGILGMSQQHRECHPGTVSGIRTSLLYSRSRSGKRVFWYFRGQIKILICFKNKNMQMHIFLGINTNQ